MAQFSGNQSVSSDYYPNPVVVHISTDGEHYWADWTNACPYTIDSVYVMIDFWDKFHKRLGDGVWGLHFITQGAHRVTRFSAPRGVDSFQFVGIRKVTTDSGEALR